MSIPNSVTEIGKSAFESCRGLTSVNIPTSVTEIDSCIFRSCHSLTSITIPNSVTKINGEAFSGCISLTSVTIPNSVTEIGAGAFSICLNLIGINVEEGSDYFCSKKGVLYNRQKNIIIQCPGATENYEFPNSVTEINESAFADCNGLTSVTIPNSVTKINFSVFQGCSSLTSITIPNSVTIIEHSVFRECRGLISMTIPNSVTQIGESAFQGCESLELVAIPAGVDKLGRATFSGCKNLRKIIDRNPTPQSIGLRAFENVPTDAIIYIPTGNLEAYKTAKGWTQFTDFRERGAFDVTLSTSALELTEGESADITATIEKDDDITIERDEWTSSNTEVASVEGGKVTAVAAGTAVIYYTVSDGYGVPHTESCTVIISGNSAVENIFADQALAAVDVYSIQGVSVLRNASATEVNNLPTGIYIVRQGNKITKVAIK